MRRPQHELVGLLVVEVDEAGVGAERVGDLARDEREHLLEVERRVDGGDRLGQQAQVPGGLVHLADCRSGRDLRVAPWITYEWLLVFHVTGAFLMLGGGVVAATLNFVAARRDRKPSEVVAPASA